MRIYTHTPACNPQQLPLPISTSQSLSFAVQASSFLSPGHRSHSDIPIAFTVEAETTPSATTNPSPNSMSKLELDKLRIADKEAVTGDTPYPSAANFEDLNLSEELLRGLYAEMKFQKPSKIQSISLPMILTPPFKDLVAQAHNGSGKTTCFVLGMLNRVDPQLNSPQALCICPTRELSLQNLEVLRRMGKYTGTTSSAAVPLDLQNEKSRDRSPIQSQVVIGTPGTIKRLMSQKILDLRTVKVLVFDEADYTLANDGFLDDSLRIIKAIEAECQVLLFSATFNEAVKVVVSRVVKDYNQLFVKKEELLLESIKQFKVHCPDEPKKIMVIKDMILEYGDKVAQTIIFVNSKQSASMLHKGLVELGYEVTTIHGALSCEQRDQIVKEFKDGFTQVLISTDTLVRGFDQSGVNLVINYDVPRQFRNSSEPHYEVYLHRMGRAGRFGRRGAVFNLLMTDEDDKLMAKIEKFYGTEVAEVKSLDNEEAFKAAHRAAGLL